MLILFNYSYQLYILISLTLNNDLPVSKAKIHTVTQNKKGFITFSVSEFSISFIKSVSQYYQRN